MSFHPHTSPARIPNFIHSLHEELNPRYRNHTANRWASRDLNPGSLTPEPVLLIAAQLEAESVDLWQVAGSLGTCGAREGGWVKFP